MARSKATPTRWSRRTRAAARLDPEESAPEECTPEESAPEECAPEESAPEPEVVDLTMDSDEGGGGGDDDDGVLARVALVRRVLEGRQAEMARRAAAARDRVAVAQGRAERAAAREAEAQDDLNRTMAAMEEATEEVTTATRKRGRPSHPSTVLLRRSLRKATVEELVDLDARVKFELARRGEGEEEEEE
jgi:uncharacterized protein with von Willebrand factor type A (vWA) domain